MEWEKGGVESFSKTLNKYLICFLNTLPTILYTVVAKSLNISTPHVISTMAFNNMKTKIYDDILGAVKIAGRVDRSVLIAQINVNHGLSQKNAEEYVDTLITAKYLYQEGNEVMWVTKNATTQPT